MNQQEIKANLPQLPLKVDGIYGDVIDSEGDNTATMDIYALQLICRQATGNAITHAINNTYGKGINPESVPEMYNALTTLVPMMNALDEPKIAKMIQDILNKATL